MHFPPQEWPLAVPVLWLNIIYIVSLGLAILPDLHIHFNATIGPLLHKHHCKHFECS